MRINRRVVGLLALWAGAAVVMGSTIWGIAGTIVVPIVRGWTVTDVASMLPGSILWITGFGLAVGIVALPAYLVGLGIWVRAARRWPVLECTHKGILGGSAALAVPLAAVVAYMLADPYWREIEGDLPVIARVAPSVIASVWGGVLLPRLIIPALRRGAFCETG